MALGSLNVTLVLNNSQFNAGMAQSGKLVVRLSGQLDQMNPATRRAENHFRSLGRTIRDSVIVLGLARNAVLNLWTVFGQLPGTMVATTAEFERMQVLLTNLSTAQGFAEKLADGKQQFQQIIDLARQAPFEIRDITDAWIKFKSAGLDPADGSLKSLLDAVSSFGGTSETMKRASIAIQQMAGKGVISMEELRQQLGEAVPTAMNKMADSMGISTGKLAKLISTGTVEATDALRRMSAEFARSYSGASEKMMNTLTGTFSVMKTEMQLFSKTIVEDSGLSDALKTAMQSITEGLKNPEVQRSVRSMAESLSSFIRILVQAAKFVYEWRDALLAASLAIGGVIAYFKIIMPLSAALVASVRTLTLAFQTAAAWTWFLGTTLRTAGIAAMLTEIRVAMLALFASNPAGWVALVIGALAAAAAAFNLFKRDVKKAAEELHDFWEAATPKQVAEAKAAIGDLRKEIRSLQSTIDTLDQQRAQGVGIDQGYYNSLVASRDEKMALLAQMSADLIQAEKSILDREQAKRASIFQRDIERLSTVLSDRAVAEEVALKEDIAKRTKNADEAAKLFAKERQAIREREFNDTVKLVDFNLAQQEAALKKSNDASQRRVISTNIQYLKELKNTITANYNQFLQDMSTGIKLTTPPGGGNQKDPLEDFMESQRIKLARYKARLAGEKEQLEEIAAFDEEVRDLGNGLFSFRDKTYSKAQIDAARNQIQQTAESKNALDLRNKAIQDSTYAFDQLGNVLGSTAEEWAAWDEVLRSGGLEIANNSVLSLRKTLGKLRESVMPDRREEFDRIAAGVMGDRANIAAAQRQVELRKQIRDNEMALMLTESQRHQAKMDAFVQEQEQYIKQNNLTAEQAANIRISTAAILAQQDAIYKLNTPLGQLAQQWIDVTAQMQQATASWVSQGSDMLVEFLETGKFAFGDFAKSILKDILKIIIRALIAQAILSAIGISPGVSTGSAFKDMIGNALGAGIPGKGFAKGGIMTSEGEMPLRRYANGGIAKRPQLAMFGEGSMPEAYVPLPDGRSIPVTMTGRQGGESPDVTVNVINQSGTQVAAEQRGGPRFDGNGYVLDVVLKAVNTPGTFRDSMRAAVR